MLDARLLEQMDFGGGNSCSAEEYLFLSSLVLLHAPARILEIGTSTGIGALAMAAAGRLFGRTCRVTTIDIPFGTATFADGVARNRRLVEHVRPEIRDSIEFVSGDSRDVLRRMAAEGRTFDFIFIDGDHTEPGVRADWQHALALAPDVIVLHDSLHHVGVATLVASLKGQYDQITFSYPPGHAGGTAIHEVGFETTDRRGYRPVSGCPGLTVFTGLRARAATGAEPAGAEAASGHEEGDRLVRQALLPRAQVHQLYAGFRFAAALEEPGLAAGGGTLEIVLTGRNDGFGGEDFNDRMFAAAAFNHQVLSDAGIPHTFTLVEWNPVPGRPLLAEVVRERLPWWGAAYVVSPAWHTKLSENPRLVFMEFFAKNVAIRRSRADWILTTNTDIFLSREVVEFIKRGPLVPGTLYRALRVDVDRRVDWRAPSWETFDDSAHHLRRNQIEAPYYLNGAGDFLLLDRPTWHRLGGFNETVRFAKIYKDGQFCFHTYAHGHPVQPIGEVYHLDHDGSFITATQTYGQRHEDAPFGPWWDAMRSYANRRDWGLTAAPARIDPAEPGLTRLDTPEDAGPEVSFVCHGGSDPAGLARAVESLLKAGRDLEIVVANPGAAQRARLPEDARVRTVDAPAGEPTAAAMNRGLAEARGRILCCVFRPWSLGERDLASVLSRFSGDPGLAAVTCSTSRPGAFAFVRRGRYERAGELDELAAMPELDWWRRLTDGVEVAVIRDGEIRVEHDDAPLDGWFVEPVVEQAWMAVGSAGTPSVADGRSAALIPAIIAEDFQRRREMLERAIAGSLNAQLSARDVAVAIWGVGDLTLPLVQAVRRTGRRVKAIYSDKAEYHGDMLAGVPVRSAADAAHDDPAVPFIVGSRAAFERAAAHRTIPASRIVHVFQPGLELKPDEAEPLACAPLAQARRLRHEGRLDDALDAVARLAGWRATSDSVLYELAELAARTKRHRMVIRLCRHLLRSMPERRGILTQWIASAYQAEGRLGAARRHFAWILKQADTDPWLKASCCFHLGELALEEGDSDAARSWFAKTLALVPDHGNASAHLRRLPPRAGASAAA